LPTLRRIRPLRASRMSVPLTLASPDSAGFLVRGAIRVAWSRLGISRIFAAIASPVQALAAPSFDRIAPAFFARSRAVAGATRGAPPVEAALCGSWTADPLRLSAGRAKGSVTRSDVPCRPLVRRRSFHFRRHRPSAASRPLGRNTARTSVFHRARTACTEHGLGTRRSPPRTPSIDRSS